MSDFFGIDIGVGSIKIVSLIRDKNEILLDGIGEVKTPRINWQDETATNDALKQIGTAIKGLMADLKIKSKQAVVSLPEDKVVSRLVQLPILKESEITDALKFEAETFVPYPLDQVSMDYEVVSQEGGRMSVFVVATKSDLVKKYVSVFKSIGIDLMAIESPAVAIKRVVNLNVDTSAISTIVVDMGEKYSDMIGIKNGNVYFTRSIGVGGESLTRAISVNLGLDIPSAEEYKKAYGLNENELEGKIKGAIMPVFTSMAEEIRKAMALFREEENMVVNLLILSGGGANLPGLAEELIRVLGVEVQVLQPLLKVNCQKIKLPFDINTEGCRFTVAVGSALRDNS
ncbi:MAG: type IV pilus assembly protein PilM [Candidatus Shapirobacteria bacterium]